MAVEIPSRPVMPTDPSLADPKLDPNSAEGRAKLREYDRDMIQYQDALQRYNRTIQMIQQQQMEESSMRSTLEKNRHDAMMSIIHNMKAG
jgi:hypothetical protein